MKDQSKKVASLKHKEQVEKSRNARLMEEARKREDNLSENSQQVKVRLACGWSALCKFCRNATAFLSQGTTGWIWHLLPSSTVKDTLRQKTERIEELEEALRESVQITAEREMVLAQEEAARSLQEKQVHKHTNIAKQYFWPSTARLKETAVLPLSPFSAATVLSLILFLSLCLSVLLLPLLSSLLVVFSCFFFPPLHTASQKHSLKAMHESNLANFKWSKVWAQYVSVSSDSYRGWTQ